MRLEGYQIREELSQAGGKKKRRRRAFGSSL